MSLAAAAPSAERIRARPGAASSASRPFQAIGLYWTGDAAPRARASADGSSWSPWFEAHAEAAVDGRHASALIHFGAGQRLLEIAGAAAEVLLIDPGDAPSPAKPRFAAARPDIVAREQWGCTPATCPVREAPVYTTPSHLIVHHSAGGNSASDWAAVVRSIWVLHTRGNGWNDIGYNYLIDPVGPVYEGRAGGDGVLGAHFSAVNTGTAGVCVLGTYSGTAPPEAGMLVLRDTLAWLAGKWNIDPLGRSVHVASGLELNHVSGHRDAGLSPRASGATECPGNGVYARLAALRRDTAELLDGDCSLRLAPVSRCASPEAAWVSIGVDAPAACEWTVSSRANWISIDRVGASATVRFQANGGAERIGTVRIGARSWTFTQAAAGAWPAACGETLVSAASLDDRPVTPGSAVSIFGAGLDGAAVSINGRAAAVLYAGSSQINAIVPPATPIGTARVSIGAGPPLLFSVSENVPAIFSGADGRALMNEPPAPGEPASLFATGITAATATVILDDAALSASVSAIAELPGLRLVTWTVPADAAPGDRWVTIRAGGVDSAPARMPVR